MLFDSSAEPVVRKASIWSTGGGSGGGGARHAHIQQRCRHFVSRLFVPLAYHLLFNNTTLVSSWHLYDAVVFTLTLK